MKLCFVVDLPARGRTDSDLHIFGGAELQCYLIGKRLALKGWNVTYITTHPTTSYGEPFHVYYARTKLHENGRLARYSRALVVFTLLRKINPDIVVTTWSGALSGLAALYCRLHHKKLIHRIAVGPESNQLAVLDRLLYQFALRNADVILTNAQDVADVYKRRLPRKNIFVVRNGLPIVPVQKSKASIVLWIGRFENVKNPIVFVRLAGELPKTQFVLGGHGSLHEECARRAEGVTNLRLIGVVDEELKKKLLNAALAFVNTSKSEGFPNTLIEAGIHGVPYLSFVDPDEVICRNSLGFHVKSLSELVEKTRLLVADSDLRKKIGINIRHYVEREHRIEDTVSQYERILTSVLNSK
jgi:glycosyltransferase involved in cell wall biosynthesis